MIGNSVVLRKGEISVKLEQGASEDIVLWKHYVGDRVTSQGKIDTVTFFADILFHKDTIYDHGNAKETTDAVQPYP